MKTKRMKKENLKDLVCCHCGKDDFKTSYLYKAHLYGHGALPANYHCEICNKSYFRNDQYKLHIARHLQKQKLHFCDYCYRSFVDKRTLIQHLRLHDDNPTPPERKNHECAYCNVVYSESRQLFYHIQRSHLDSQSNHLKMGINDTWVETVKNTTNCVEITKVKNNVLTIKKLDVKLNNVDLYQQIKARLFSEKEHQFRKVKCDYCKKEMLKKSILNHIRERHLKLKKFKCDVCKIGFSRHYMLMNHTCGKTGQRKRRIRKQRNKTNEER